MLEMGALSPVVPKILIALYTLIICFQVIVSVALWRVAKRNATFILLAEIVSMGWIILKIFVRSFNSSAEFSAQLPYTDAF